MSLSNYAGACVSLARELATALTPEDATALAQDLATLGNEAWCRWCVEQEGDVTDYVSATPSRRESRKAWQDARLRRRLVLAGWQRCLESAALLRVLARNEALLQPGGRYRDMAALAAVVYWEIDEENIPLWPPEWSVPCPFFPPS